MFDKDVLNDEEIVVEDINAASIATAVTAVATTNVSIDDITLDQALVEIKTSKPKARDADYKLAARLQEEEQGELTIEEKSRLFMELVDKRKKHFAKLIAEEQRRKPPTKAQKSNQIKMLKNFDREDLKVLLRLVKDRFVKSKLVDDIDSFLLHTLNIMFKHHVEDTVWKNQQGLAKVKNWMLFDSYGV
nr:hypothetical protein [Tanacetum cinerariifolium]